MYLFAVNISTAICSYDGSIGGDRVEAFTSPDGTVHLIVLDACGHGAPAEQLATLVLHFVKSCLWLGSTPADVFNALNAFLLAKDCDRDAALFGTGAIVSLDCKRSLATFASAGHIDVLRFTSDGKRHYRLAPTGPLYGVVREATYEDEVFSYSGGDTFVLLTDGLVDATPVDNRSRFVGTHGVCEIIHRMFALSGAFSALRLISTVKGITGAFRDDVAALVAAIPPLGTIKAVDEEAIPLDAA